MRRKESTRKDGSDLGSQILGSCCLVQKKLGSGVEDEPKCGRF